MFGWLFRRNLKGAKRFEDVVIDKSARFSIGIDNQRRGFFLSIPVSGRLVDYEEYYRISRREFDKFRSDLALGASFADRCRQRLMDRRLLIKPGADRGVGS
jgi:hypothetical protein